MALSLREQLFVDAYLGEAKGNATQAARIAGYGSPHVTCARLLAKARIQDAIGAALKVSAMSRDEVLARLSERGRASLGDYLNVDADGSFQIDLIKAKRSHRLGNLKKLKIKRVVDGDEPAEIVDIEVFDNVPALSLLSKFHGIVDKSSATDGDEWRSRREAVSDDVAAAVLKAAGDGAGGPA